MDSNTMDDGVAGTIETAPEEYFSRDDILGAKDAQFESVEVPEWGSGKKVRVKALSGTERDAFESSLLIGEGKKQKLSTENIRAKLCAMSIVDGKGQRLFGDRDIKLLGQKSAAALDRVYAVAQRLSKFTDEDMEELKGNSDSEASEDLSSE